MASIMRLRQAHKRHHAVTSPLVSNAQEYTEAEIEEFVKTYYANPTKENQDAAVMSFASIIRYITARYIGAFRSVISLEDDLITRGFMVVMAAMDERVPVEDVCRVVSSRIISAQTEEIHNARASGVISLRTQRRRVRDGNEALYPVQIDDSHDSFDFDSSLSELEFYRSLIERKDLDSLDRQLLRPENWSKTRLELAEKYGVSLRTIRLSINKLIKISKEMLYAD